MDTPLPLMTLSPAACVTPLSREDVRRGNVPEALAFPWLPLSSKAPTTLSAREDGKYMPGRAAARQAVERRRRRRDARGEDGFRVSRSPTLPRSVLSAYS